MIGAQGIQINEPCGDDCGLSLKSDLQSILMGFSVIVFLIAFKARLPNRLDDRLVRIWRRFLACFVDYFICLSVVFTILACVIIAWNAFQTGSVEWQIELAASVETALLTILQALLSVMAVFGYFTWHKKRRLPTVGQYICGFMIVRDDNRPRRYWWYGTLIAFVAMCSVHLWVWFKSLREPKDGAYWWDRDAGTRPKTFF